MRLWMPWFLCVLALSMCVSAHAGATESICLADGVQLEGRLERAEPAVFLDLGELVVVVPDDARGNRCDGPQTPDPESQALRLDGMQTVYGDLEEVEPGWWRVELTNGAWIEVIRDFVPRERWDPRAVRIYRRDRFALFGEFGGPGFLGGSANLEVRPHENFAARMGVGGTLCEIDLFGGGPVGFCAAWNVGAAGMVPVSKVGSVYLGPLWLQSRAFAGPGVDVGIRLAWAPGAYLRFGAQVLGVAEDAPPIPWLGFGGGVAL